MEWIKLIVVAIGIVAWIAGNIKEQQKLKAPPIPPPLPEDDIPDVDAAQPPRQPDNIQDFLRDIRRRMQETESDKAKEPTPIVAELVEDQPKPITPPPPVFKPINLPKPRTVIPTGAPTYDTLTKRPPESRWDKIPSSQSTSAANSLSTSMSDSAKSFSAKTFSEPILPPPRQKVSSPAVREALALLKSPTTLASAFILREILDQPLSKRRIATLQPNPVETAFPSPIIPPPGESGS